MLDALDLPTIVLAVASLGTAAYGVVDATKGFGGGISNRGFGDIRAVISKLIPAHSDGSGGEIGPRPSVCSRNASSQLAQRHVTG